MKFWFSQPAHPSSPQQSVSGQITAFAAGRSRAPNKSAHQNQNIKMHIYGTVGHSVAAATDP